jgi:hypothetical protein
MTSRGVSSAGANARASRSFHRAGRSVIAITGRTSEPRGAVQPQQPPHTSRTAFSIEIGRLARSWEQNDNTPANDVPRRSILVPAYVRLGSRCSVQNDSGSLKDLSIG